jgi:hypothetical protein
MPSKKTECPGCHLETSEIVCQRCGLAAKMDTRTDRIYPTDRSTFADRTNAKGETVREWAGVRGHYRPAQ